MAAPPAGPATGPPPPGSPAEIDLEAWTVEEIYAEAQRAFLAAWEERESWGLEPVATLADYVAANDYPPRIRGTLRDAVGYLWVELLADRSLWSPAESDEIYRLDLAALIAGSGEGVDFGDPAVHPLRKLAAVLGDLEAWHRAGGRAEAAFEARRARLDQLNGAFDRPEDAEALKTDLRTQLDLLGRDAEWWSMGMATLAEWTQGEDAPGAPAAAHDLAAAGEVAHPASVGGRLCAHLRASIEAPTYDLMAMASDGPGRRSLAVDHQNLDRLYFRAYRLDLAARLASARDGNALPRSLDLPSILAGRPAGEWSVALPPTPNYRRHRTYVTPPLARPGLYTIVASVRADFAEDHNRRSAVNLIVGDLVLISEGEGGGYEVTVRSGRTGRAVAGCRSSSGPTSGTAASAGSPSRPPAPTAGCGSTPTGRGVRGGSWWRNGGTRSPSTPSTTPASTPASRASARRRWSTPTAPSTGRRRPSTGRRSSTTRRRRGALRHPARHRPHRRAGGSRLQGRGFDHGQDQRLRLGVGSLRDSPGRLLGEWTVRASHGGHRGPVEEYKRPTFEVTVRDPAEPLRLNRPATLTAEARYYFGLPVAAGGVHCGWSAAGLSPLVGGVGVAAVGETQTAGNLHRRAALARLAADGTFEVTFTPAAADPRRRRRALLPLPAERRPHR